MTSRRSGMLKLCNAAKGDNVHFGNLLPEDREHVYEVQIKGFDKCTKSDQDIQYDLGNVAWSLLKEAGYLYLPCKLLGRWLISRSQIDEVIKLLYFTIPDQN